MIEPPCRKGTAPSEAQRAVSEAGERILRRLHPGIAWTAEPSCVISESAMFLSRQSLGEQANRYENGGYRRQQNQVGPGERANE